MAEKRGMVSIMFICGLYFQTVNKLKSIDTVHGQNFWNLESLGQLKGSNHVYPCFRGQVHGHHSEEYDGRQA